MSKFINIQFTQKNAKNKRKGKENYRKITKFILRVAKYKKMLQNSLR